MSDLSKGRGYRLRVGGFRIATKPKEWLLQAWRQDVALLVKPGDVAWKSQSRFRRFLKFRISFFGVACNEDLHVAA